LLGLTILDEAGDNFVDDVHDVHDVPLASHVRNLRDCRLGHIVELSDAFEGVAANGAPADFQVSREPPKDVAKRLVLAVPVNLNSIRLFQDGDRLPHALPS